MMLLTIIIRNDIIWIMRMVEWTSMKWKTRRKAAVSISPAHSLWQSWYNNQHRIFLKTRWKLKKQIPFVSTSYTLHSHHGRRWLSFSQWPSNISSGHNRTTEEDDPQNHWRTIWDWSLPSLSPVPKWFYLFCQITAFKSFILLKLMKIKPNKIIS